MITEDTKKRLYKLFLIAAVSIGALFVLYAVFLNRGTLTVVAEAPYIITVDELKTQACNTEKCSTTVAPGDYSILVKKQGYKDESRDVAVPIGGEAVEEIEFTYIPVLREVSPEEDIRVFGMPNVDISDLGDTEPFYDENYLVYLARSTENGRQTLYLRNLLPNDSEDENAEALMMGEPVVATSFIRTVDDYTIFPFIDSQNKIIFVDRSGAEAALYLIDLSEKTRKNILTFPVIADVKWLPGTDDLLIEAIGQGKAVQSVYRYSSADMSTKDLGIQTPLSRMEALDSETLLIATNQVVVGPGTPDELSGGLVSLSTETSNIVNFITYDISSKDIRYLAQTIDLYDLEEVYLRTDKRGLYLLQGAKIFELKIAE
ncbi:hypothetical protein ACFL2V_11540 [Pseudomonadota bacterium]